MIVPKEIIPVILSSFEKHELKTARQVSPAWCTFGSERLFDQLYFSGSQEDLDVFVAVTNHPTLRHCIKKLIYDVSCFKKMIFNKEHYCHTLGLDWEKWCEESGKHPFENPFHQTIPEVIKWPHETKPEDADYIENEDEGIRSKLDEGYEKYKEHAQHQQYLLDSGELLSRLIHGLHQLENLSTVQFGYVWEIINLGTKRKGSPLNHAWDPYYCRPHPYFFPSPKSALPRFKPEAENGTEHYKILVQALAATQKVVSRLDISPEFGHGLPAFVFDMSSDLGRGLSQLVKIGPGLEYLSLRLPWINLGFCMAERFPNIDGLTLLLASMTNLKELNLKMPDDVTGDDARVYYNITQVFANHSWPHLEQLTMRYVTATAPNLLELVLKRMPKLERLHLGWTILEGIWQEVFEALAASKRIRTFGFEPNNSYCIDEDSESDEPRER